MDNQNGGGILVTVLKLVSGYFIIELILKLVGELRK